MQGHPTTCPEAMQDVDAWPRGWYSDPGVRTRWVLAGVLALVAALAGATRVHAGAAAIVAALDDEASQCNFLVFLCREANRASEQAELVPPAGQTEVLAFKRAHEARLLTRDAVEAARVIREKHEGARPWCFDDPQCGFLKDALGSR
jgi:hypothetical protein